MFCFFAKNKNSTLMFLVALPDNMDKHIKFLRILLVHQLLCQTILLLWFLIKERSRLPSIRRRPPWRKSCSYNMTQRIHLQPNPFHRIFYAGDVQCVSNLRMNRNAFVRLCYLLGNLGGLVGSRMKFWDPCSSYITYSLWSLTLSIQMYQRNLEMISGLPWRIIWNPCRCTRSLPR